MVDIKEYIARELFNRLDAMQATLIEVLKALDKQNEENSLMTNIFLSNALPASMLSTEQLTIGITPVLLVKNDSLPLMRVRFTNDDAAQSLWTGTSNVNNTNGEVIPAGTFRDYSVPRGFSIYGVCAVATISVRRSYLADPLGELKAQGFI